MVSKNLRMPDDLAKTAGVFARGAGLSLNAFVCDAIREKVEACRSDPRFMKDLKALLDQDRASAGAR